MKNINKTYLALTCILFPVAVFFCFSIPWGFGADFWETAATVTELSKDLVNPTNPIVALPGNTSPRFTPFTLLWGAVQGITGFGVFTIMALAGLVNYLIFVAGLYRFIAQRFDNTRLPVIVFIAMLFVWGTGYEWANAYHFEGFFIMLPYVGFFSFAVSLHALYYFDKYYKNNNLVDVLIYTVLSAIAFITHPITGLFCFITTFAIALEYKDIKKGLLLQLVPVFAFVVTFTWPYFNYLHVFTKGTADEWFKASLFDGQIEALGLAILGIPIIILFAIKRKNLFLVYGLGICLFIYLFSSFASINVGGRFVIYSAFFLHIALAYFVYENGYLSKEGLRNSLKTNGFALVLIATIVLHAGSFRLTEVKNHLKQVYNKPFTFHSYDNPAKDYFFLKNIIKDSDIVLGTTYESWVIPAITGAKIVSVQKENPLLVTEARDRNRDVASFYDDSLSVAQRVNILQKYQVTHLIIDKHGSYFRHNRGKLPHQSLFDQIADFAQPVEQRKNVILYKIKTSIIRQS